MTAKCRHYRHTEAEAVCQQQSCMVRNIKASLRPGYRNMIPDGNRDPQKDERDRNTKPPDVPLEKSVCRSRSNS